MNCIIRNTEDQQELIRPAFQFSLCRHLRYLKTSIVSDPQILLSNPLWVSTIP